MLAPVLAAAGLVVIAYLILVNFDALLGVAADSPLRWAFPASYAVLALAGVAWALYLRRARPDGYAAIGLGAPTPAAHL